MLCMKIHNKRAKWKVLQSVKKLTRSCKLTHVVDEQTHAQDEYEARGLLGGEIPSDGL